MTYTVADIPPIGMKRWNCAGKLLLYILRLDLSNRNLVEKGVSGETKGTYLSFSKDKSKRMFSAPPSAFSKKHTDGIENSKIGIQGVGPLEEQGIGVCCL